MDFSEIHRVIEESEFFKDLGQDHREKIAALCRLERCRAGDRLFSQGSPGDELFIIAEGQVALERSMDLGARKGSVTIDSLGAGKILGAWSTLFEQPHVLMSSAVCRRPSTVVAIRGSDLRELMQENNELGFLILKRLCGLLRDRIQAAYGAFERI